MNHITATGGGCKLAVIALSWWLASWWSNAATLYVRVGGDDLASGASWAEAVGKVNRALQLAAPGDEVWVASGSYTNAVVMKAGVALLGGFRGNESNRTERDRFTNETILDGGSTNVVVYVESGGAETIVDGFTIQHGSGCGVRLSNSGAVISQNRIRWNKSSSTISYGAGVSVKNLGANVAAIIQDNVIFENYAYDGGGIACIDASPHIKGNTIAWNTAVQNGGGISCWRNSSPLIENNAIYGNTASWVIDDAAVPIGGGGVFATADDLDGRPHPTARSAPIIRNNSIAANGGANGGGIALVDANGGIPVVVNNTVVANNGSGILWGSSALMPIAPIVINNVVAFNPWGMEQLAGTPTNAVLSNNCVFGNRVHTFGGDYRRLSNLTGTNGNISADPQLVSRRYGNLHLRAGSPCLDAGMDLGAMLGSNDIDGQSRMMGSAVDIGADESSGAAWMVDPKVIRVNGTGRDDNDGVTWMTAKRTVAAALDAIRPTGGEVWVAAGSYSGQVWLPAFVHLYGGFAGNELSRGERLPAVQKTILDGGGRPNVVMSGQGGFGVSTLDGFTVTGGGVYTAGTNLNKYGLGGKGGGILVSVSSPVITSNVITRNSLAYDNTTNQFPSYGAGIACEWSYATIEGNTITENEILNDFDGSGAGVYCRYSMPLILGNRITRNQAKYGPAVYAWASTPLIVRNTIEDNSMYVRMPLFFGAVEGAVSVHLAEDALIDGNFITGNTAGTGAGIHFSAYQGGLILNNLLVGNHAYDPTAYGGMGGGLYVLVTTNATSAIRVANNTIVSNVASNLFQEMGGGIAYTLVPPATNLIIANNLVLSNSSGIYQTLTTPMMSPLLSHNNVYNLRANYSNVKAGSSDLSRAVSFVNAAARDYRLDATSSAGIDAADPDYAPRLDLAGVARPLDGNADGTAVADLGAYEFVHATADSDADSLPDWWEVAMHTDPILADSENDPDHDEASNAHEYAAATDPQDPQSVLGVVMARTESGAFQLTWTSVMGRLYDIDCATHIGPSADWKASHSGIAGTGQVVGVEIASQPGSTEFYRIRVRGL